MNDQAGEIKQAIENKAEGITHQLQKEIEASGQLTEQMIEQLRSQLEDNKELSELSNEKNFKQMV